MAVWVCVVLVVVLGIAGQTVGLGDGSKNVLLIAVDDLRPVGQVMGEPEVIAPNLDALASKSTFFEKAYCQAATCGVSRSSLLTSRRPDTTQVLGNGGCPFTTQPEHKSWKSLPQYFREHGFTTAGMGKIFHPGVCEGASVGEQKAAWTLDYYHAPCIQLGSIYDGHCEEKPTRDTSIYRNETANDSDMPDGMIADRAIETLKNVSKLESPWFVAVGFHKPHLPHIAPAKYFDLYTNVSLPSNPYSARNLPKIAWNECSEPLSYPDWHAEAKASGFAENKSLSVDAQRRHRHGYFAAVSYMDAQLGRVLQTLEDLGEADNTIIALFGDHGWHLGENNEWGKHTAMTKANNAPLMFHVPGIEGKVVQQWAEFVDIMPTLSDLAGIPVPEVCTTPEDSLKASACTEGHSLRSIIQDSSSPGKPAAFGQWPKSDKMGYNIYTTINGSEFRYTEWVGYSDHAPVWKEAVGVELYNRTADPGENNNLALDSRVQSLVADLSAQLHKGWRALI